MNKNSEIRKKLGLPQIIGIIALNAAGPFFLFLIAGLILDGTPTLASGENDWIVYAVCAAGIGIGLLALDVAYLWIPLKRLNRRMQRYQNDVEACTIEDMKRASEPERLFAEIVTRQKEYMEREYKMEALKRQAELMALQSQINPHFLYNTLDSIRGVALENNVKQIADMTEALSKLFRSMIANEGLMVTLGEELQSIDNYMLIQQFRFDHRIGYQMIVEDDSLMKYWVPNLIIQPIVENAVIHGLERKEEGGCINISGYTTQSRLVISVEDNGVGIRPEKLDELNSALKQRNYGEGKETEKGRLGFALLNIDQRIKLRFGEKYGLSIMSTPGISTTVEIVLPVIPEKQDGEQK